MKKAMLGVVAMVTGLGTANGLAQTVEKVAEHPKKVLVAYYSYSGNTKTVAEQIHKVSGGDIFEIKMAKPYPTAYQEVVDQAKKEIRAGFKPELKDKVQDISKYEVIFIGSPNWWSTIAPPVATFLTSYNLAGKTVIPFVTHGGGGMARCAADVKKLCPKATVLEGRAYSGGSVRQSQNDVSKWVKGVLAPAKK